ncbi:MAG: putative Ig domain-containing protein [Actinobacteria bacterium]|nr:putative Ig domain-containing protein [Actinomycetota bacterium]
MGSLRSDTQGMIPWDGPGRRARRARTSLAGAHRTRAPGSAERARRSAEIDARARRFDEIGADIDARRQLIEDAEEELVERERRLSLAEEAVRDRQEEIERGAAEGGSYQVWLAVKNQCPGDSSERLFTFYVVDLEPLFVRTGGFFPAVKGSAYSYQLLSSESGVLTWTINSGRLPPGLRLTPQGLILGNPTAHGSFSFRVKVNDGRRRPRRTSRSPFSRDLRSSRRRFGCGWVTPSALE